MVRRLPHATLIHVYRLLCWWTHCLADMLLHKAVAASAKIYMLESHWHSEGGDTSEAYLCLNRENRHVQCCADGCWTTHVGKWGGSVWKLILLKTDKVIRFLCTSLQRESGSHILLPGSTHQHHSCHWSSPANIILDHSSCFMLCVQL